MNHKTEYKPNTTRRLLVATGLGLACLAAPARSQDANSDGVYELDAFSISASRLEIPVQQVGSTVDVLDSYDLRDGQELFLVDALREVPGLLMRNNGGPGGTFGITTRGMSSNRPTVLVNGIEVSNPSNGQVMNLGNLFTGAASRVEVLRGPQSSLYGADALAGVISVDTLGAGSLPGGRLLLGYGSYDTYDYALGHSGSQGSFSWSVDAMRHESEGFSAQSPEYGWAWADDDTYDNTTLSGAVRFELDETTSFYASALYLDTYSEFDPGVPSPWNANDGGDRYSTSEQLFLRAGSEFRIQDNWTSTANIAYSDVDMMSYTNGWPYNAIGERFKYDWVNTVKANDAWTFVGGVEYEDEDNISDVGSRTDTSIFMENVLALSEDLDVTLGARYDDNSAYGSETTYRATFSYRIDDVDARVRGSFGTSFQAPSFYQLFNGTYGNPDLKPESGEGWDLGIEKNFAGGKVQVASTLFGNKVDDKIDWDGVYKNVSKYESVGIENAIRYYPTDDLRFKVAYTYSDAEENGTVEALRVPRNVTSLGVNYQMLDGRLALNANVLAVSSQYSDGGSRFAGTKLEGYEVMNLAANYELNDLHSLWIRIGNVFDTEYEEIAGYQTAGANVNAGVRMNF
ncbi:TonB-dependent receptor plug domain-containing protein [Pelagicoccus mobilis]|uniref:TonB-dependent receptor n=1 Tax=Pelagicoccus mobilis TaxID=415221 RepID=A0A934VSN0_9BACT|nr:TonB-dependent receptor [Pelagicoccus mobilis]MBK1878674.1 TonB-dependent receptor [Pelagicoccus mobilis]